MNLGLKRKTISFIGLFFLASISLHSFAHIDENPLTERPQLECQTCLNEVSSAIEVFVFLPSEIFPQIVDQESPQDFSLLLNKPFHSQAPPKINI
jgi:hypothetical protein